MSFSLDGDGDDDDEASDGSSADEVPVKKIKKNPDVDTSFLPDREREEEETKLREELRQVVEFTRLFSYFWSVEE